MERGRGSGVQWKGVGGDGGRILGGVEEEAVRHEEMGRR